MGLGSRPSLFYPGEEWRKGNGLNLPGSFPYSTCSCRLKVLANSNLLVPKVLLSGNKFFFWVSLSGSELSWSL